MLLQPSRHKQDIAVRDTNSPSHLFTTHITTVTPCPLTQECGDSLEVRSYQRLSPLVVMAEPLGHLAHVQVGALTSRQLPGGLTVGLCLLGCGVWGLCHQVGSWFRPGRCGRSVQVAEAVCVEDLQGHIIGTRSGAAHAQLLVC